MVLSLYSVYWGSIWSLNLNFAWSMLGKRITYSLKCWFHVDLPCYKVKINLKQIQALRIPKNPLRLLIGKGIFKNRLLQQHWDPNLGPWCGDVVISGCQDCHKYTCTTSVPRRVSLNIFPKTELGLFLRKPALTKCQSESLTLENPCNTCQHQCVAHKIYIYIHIYTVYYILYIPMMLMFCWWRVFLLLFSDRSPP